MSSSILLFSACLQLIFGGLYKKFSYNKESIKSFFLIASVTVLFTFLLEKENELVSLSYGKLILFRFFSNNWN